MKKFLVIILSLLYMATATGATVQLHYCMGKLISASLLGDGGKDDACDDCCKDEPKLKGCCKDEQKTFKANDHQNARVIFDCAQHVCVVPSLLLYNTHTPFICAIRQSLNAKVNAPPTYPLSNPIYLRFRNFRL